MRRSVFFLLIVGPLLAGFVVSCKKDKLLTDSGVSLKFSVDTVQFDTVFSSVGSATQVFTVTNPYNQPINISSISLSGAYFRLNVNGVPGKAFTNIEMRANDSIWIFAEVTIDPHNTNTPFIVSDSIAFITNGTHQYLPLVAYGQDAHFFPSTKEGTTQKSTCSSLFILSDTSTKVINKNLHWTNDKPYVIYGYAILDAGYTLTIDPGTRIHFHNNSGLIISSNASIKVNGTQTDPVTFQGDRLDFNYADVPGQWDRILLSNITAIDLTKCPPSYPPYGKGPSGNIFNYAIIKNGYVGIEADSIAGAHVPAVILNNTIVKNFASTGLYGAGSNIEANNCIFANCGQYCTAMYYGGDYRFLHCTIANYWNKSTTGERQTPAVFINNYYDVVRPIDSAYFGNCIIYGSNDGEIGFDSAGVANAFNFVFDHCLIKVDSKTSTASSAHYRSISHNVDPMFADVDNNNYLVDSTTSVVIDYLGSIANFNLNPIILSTDLRGRNRPQGASPDLGAYEMR